MQNISEQLFFRTSRNCISYVHKTLRHGHLIVLNMPLFDVFRINIKDSNDVSWGTVGSFPDDKLVSKGHAEVYSEPCQRSQDRVPCENN